MPRTFRRYESPLDPQQAAQLRYDWRSRVHTHEVAIRPFRYDDVDEPLKPLLALIAAIDADAEVLRRDQAGERELARSKHQQSQFAGEGGFRLTEEILTRDYFRHDFVALELWEELEKLNGLAGECRVMLYGRADHQRLAQDLD